MRSRLAYTLSFWLLGTVALSVLAMGGLTAWNLREGFSTYLQARDLDRVGRFVTLVEARFLRSQYLGITAVASLLLLPALGCAFWLARQWVRLMAAVQAATARIAQGELDVRPAYRTATFSACSSRCFAPTLPVAGATAAAGWA